MTSGTCNGGDRGNTADRRRRREWLVAAFRADVDIIRIYWPSANEWTESPWSDDLRSIADRSERLAACRCYRCGELLSVHTVSPDRIIPGCQGGTYRRNNIRPACLRCQSVTGNEIKARMRATA